MSLPQPILEKFDLQAGKEYAGLGFGRRGIERGMVRMAHFGYQQALQDVLDLLSTYVGDTRHETRAETCDTLAAGVRAMIQRAEE
jgi:hypothetical protein